MCLLLVACGVSTPAPSADESALLGDEQSEALAAPYATQGELALTTAEFQQSIAWREWVTGQPIEEAYGDEWVDDDALLRRLTASLFDEALLLHDATQWGLTVSEQERSAAVAEIPVAAQLLGMNSEERGILLAEAELSWDDVERAAELAVLIGHWNQYRIDSLTEVELRNAYRLRNDRAALEIALVPNLHSSQTVQEIVATRGEEIERYYSDHANFFLQPRGARLREVAVAGALEDDGARAHAQSLRDRVADSGFDTLTEEEVGTQPITRGNRLAWVPQAQFPPAFDVLPGELSEVVRFREHWVFFELFEHRGREMRPLDEAVRTQIAHHFAREEGAAAVPLAQATEMASELRANPDNAATIYRSHRILSETTSSFRRTSSGVVPTLGEAPSMSALVFADGVEVGDVIGPVHVPAGIAVARVISRQRVSDEGFQEERETFTEEFAGYMRNNAWPARVAEYGAGHERALDLGALRASLAE